LKLGATKLASNTSQNPVSNQSTTVPPLKVVFEEADRKAILIEIDKCLSSGWVAAGKYVKEFEEFWADYCGCTHAVACGSGGAALELLMKALGVEGKDVLVPTNTFVASANSIIFAGGNPVFLDTDPKTMGVSLEEIKRQVTDNTTGVMVVHIGGIISPEMPQIAA
jgi:dTDP-4-amino-4,6-dideoxygalactose transaminase